METLPRPFRAYGIKSLKSSTLRTVDVARRSGYSVQQIRNFERGGVLPLAVRTTSGYRTYAEPHVRAAWAYREFAVGVGPIEAKAIMRAAHRDRRSDLLALLDAAHARLHAERRILALAREAVGAIAAEPIGDVRTTDSMRISECAAALGMRPSTLRHCEAEGLVVPRRVSTAQARRYSPGEVADARIAHQLRRAGYRIAVVRAVRPELRDSHRQDEVKTVLADSEASIDGRSLALLNGAAALSAASCREARDHGAQGLGALIEAVVGQPGAG